MFYQSLQVFVSSLHLQKHWIITHLKGQQKNMGLLGH